MANKVQFDVGVNFKAEGTQLQSYINNLSKDIKALQEGTGKSEAFKETQDSLKNISDLMIKISNFKLNTDNYLQFIKLQDQMRDALESLDKQVQADGQSFEDYGKKAKEAKERLEELIAIRNAGKNENGKYNIDDKEVSPQVMGKMIKKEETAYQENKKAAEENAEAILRLNNIRKEAGQVIEKGNGMLVESTKVTMESAKADAEFHKESTLRQIKRKIEYYTGLTFSIQLVRKALREAIKTYQELDKSITSIAMVSGLSRDTLWGQIDTYNNLAKELGTTTGEVLNAAKLYYQQGRDTNSVIQLTTESLKLAAIAGLGTADATNYLTAAVNGYKMEAADASEVTDVWAQLAAKNAVSVKELSVAISKVASIAQSAGMDIQSTSAFLTQMIATTREAPENLGTALKTIISRFQELKQSGAALEDGVDANKVEKALKTVGISLRDAAGQFRDFDDVILELSSKWDSLDRNTQRYIATIAAGSRQQSRFIALVSDYEGLTKIMDQAANAEGAANKQFETYTEGLQASINRLKASWEGFYTSVSKGHNIFTGIIDLLAKLIDALGKIGPFGTLAFGSLTISLAKLGIQLTKAKGIIPFIQSIKSTAATLSGTESLSQILSAFGEGLKETAPALAQTATNLGSLKATSTVTATSLTNLIGPLSAVVIAIGALTLAYQLYKKWEKKPETWREESQAAGQASKRYKEYADSIEEAVKAGQDWSDIRERLLNEDEEFLKGIDAENASTKELIDTLRQREEEEKRIAIIKQAASEQETNRRISHTTTVRDDYGNEHEAYSLFPIKELDALSKSTAQDLAENVEDLFEGIHINSTQAEEEINALTVAFQKWGAEFDKDGNLKGESFNIQEYLESVRHLSPELKEAFNQLTEGVNGEDLHLDETVYDNLRKELGPDFEELIDTFEKQAVDLRKSIDDGLAYAFSDENNQISGSFRAILRGITISDDISSSMKQSILQALNNMDADIPEMQEAFISYIRGIMDIDPEALNQEMIDAFENRDFESVYAQMLKANPEDLNVELLDYFKNIIGEVSAAFLEGKQAVDEYNSALSSLNDLTSGASLNDYADSIWALSENWQELGFETRQAMLEQLWANTVVDESGHYMQAESELLDDLRNKYDLSTEAARKEAINVIQAEKKKVDARILAVDERLAELGVSLEAAQTELKAEQEAAKGKITTEAASHRFSIEAIKQHAKAVWNFIKNTLNPLNQAAGKSGVSAGTIELDDFTSIENAAIEEIMSSASGEAIKSMQSASALAALRNKLQSYSDTLAQQAATIEWYQGEADAKKSGGGGGGSSKETTDAAKEAADALKKLADAAKEAASAAKDAAKVELDAIKARLDARKDELKKEQDLTKDAVEAEKHQRELQLEVYLKMLKDQLDGLKKQVDDAKKVLEDENDALKDQADTFIDAYNLEIDGIQAKIDALDKEAEAEDRLRKLQEARDAYERARNQRTRLVLTQGAGWIFKTDTEALNQARDGLKNAERDYQKSVLQDQIDALKEQIDYWQEAKENIGKSAEELEHYKNLLQEAQDIIAKGGGADALNKFISSVGANNKNVDRVQALEDEYNKQNDATVEGSLAAQIELLEGIKDKLDWSLDDFADEIAKKQYEEGFKAQLENGKDWLDITNQLDSDITTYIYGSMKEQLQVISDIDTKLETLDELKKDYEKAGKNIGLSTKELEAQKALEEKYNKLTEEDLAKNSEYWNNLEQLIQTSINKQDEYLKAQEAYEKAQKQYEADKNAAKSVAAAQGAVNGDGVGTAIAGSYNSGNSRRSGDLTESTPPHSQVTDHSINNPTGSGNAIVHEYKRHQDYSGDNPTGSGTPIVTTPATPTVSEPNMRLIPAIINNDKESLNYYTINIKTTASTIKDNITEAMRLMKLSNYSTDSMP